jgi:hypothetical protein
MGISGFLDSGDIFLPINLGSPNKILATAKYKEGRTLI